jgi:hypothetical protein
MISSQCHEENKTYNYPLKDLSEIVFNNFLFEISEFLTKKEKCLLREVKKSFHIHSFSEFKINLILGGEGWSQFTQEPNNPSNINATTSNTSHNLKPNIYKILDYYKNTPKLSIENIRITQPIIEVLELIILNNKDKIKDLILNNVEYSQNEFISQLVTILNQLQVVENISVYNVGNRDKLFLHLQVNNKKLDFAKNINKLKIYNILPKQIDYIMDHFCNLKELKIKNCSLGDDLEGIYKKLQEKKYDLVSLDLSENGLDSTKAVECLKNIVNLHGKLEKLTIKGLWTKDISQLYAEKETLQGLSNLNLSASKYIFSLQDTFKLFQNLNRVQVLNLADCRLDDNDFQMLCSNLVSTSLSEFILYRNLLTNNAIDSLVANGGKFLSLKKLDFSFNIKINSMGFKNLLNFLSSSENELRHLDVKNTSINLKQSTNSLIHFIQNKKKYFKLLEMFFCQFSEVDYKNFVKLLYEALFQKNILEDQINNKMQNLNLNKAFMDIKIFLKLDRETNKKLFQSVETLTKYLYTNFNIVIR